MIGQNGSGKSNLIEAIVTIFRDLDLNEKTTFDYELTYQVRGQLVKGCAENPLPCGQEVPAAVEQDKMPGNPWVAVGKLLLVVGSSRPIFVFTKRCGFFRPRRKPPNRPLGASSVVDQHFPNIENKRLLASEPCPR